MSKKIYRSVVVTLLLLSGSFFAKANTYTASRTGAWTTPSTWGQTTKTPTSADNVIIPSGFTVTVSSTNAVALSVIINSGGKLTINNRDRLTIGSGLNNAGTVTLGTNSILSDGGALVNSGSISVSAGTFTVSGTSNNAGTLSVTNGTLTAVGTMTNSGTLSDGTGDILLGSSLNNSGNMTVAANGGLTFNGAANSTIMASSGTYTITGTVTLNMGSATTVLDVQDPDFINGINSGNKYYFTFTNGVFQMDNSGTLNNAYNSGSSTALTIPYGVTIESDDGTMNLASKGTTGNVVLSGKLFINGGTVNVQTGQARNAGPSDDFQYSVNGGTPQLYISSGSLTLGGGFSPKNGTSYIDFNMTGGTMLVTSLEASNNASFQLQDVTGGKTVMSGGKITIEEPGLGSNPDLDMGGAHISPYSVTGGTVQMGTSDMQSAGGWFGFMPYPTTNYPNIDLEPGTDETFAAHASGNFNFLSLYINSNATFDASSTTSGSGMTNLNIMGSDGAYAFDDEGTFTPGTNTVQFSGSQAQVITSGAVSPLSFYNLTVANTSGNVALGVATRVTNQLAFTSGKLDASAYPLTITNGARTVTGTGNSSYVITGDGVTNTGYLAIQNLSRNSSTTFPIGTSTYYLPATINPGTNGNTAYNAFVYPGVTATGKSNGGSLSSALLSDMTHATWDIARAAGSGSATLGLNWASVGTALEGTDFQSFGPSIGITQYTTGNWSTAGANGNESTHTASTSFSSFSQFSVAGTAITLPMVLADFTATPKGGTVVLAWAAFPDGQPASFTIQRSLDGLAWNDIGVVQADAGATQETDYTHTDVSPVTGDDYYRLYIQNADGSSNYSPVRMVAFTATARVSVYPNPANTALTVNLGHSTKRLNIRLVNTAGTVLQSTMAEAGATTLTMNTGIYPTGVYYVETLDGGQLLQTTAVMVAH